MQKHNYQISACIFHDCLATGRFPSKCEKGNIVQETLKDFIDVSILSRQSGFKSGDPYVNQLLSISH